MSALGSLVVKLGLDYAQFTAGLDKSEQEALAHAKRVQDTFDGLKGKVVGVAGAIAGGLAAAFTIGAFKSLMSESVAAGAALDDLSMQTGATVEALSGLAEVGKFNNLSAQNIGAAMNVLTRNLAGTTEESKGAGAALKALGLNVDEFRQLKPEDQMQVLAKSLDGVQDGAGKSAVMMALYGKQGAEMLPFMKDLATVGELQARITTDQAAAAARLDDNWTKLTTTGSETAKEVATGMVPAFDQAVRAAMDVMSGGTGIRETMRGLVADGSIERWTKSAIHGLSYVADVGQIAWRVLQSVGKGLGGLAAALVIALQGDFRGAWRALGESGQDMVAVFDSPTLGARFRESLANVASSSDAAGDSAKKAALDFRNLGSGGSKAATELEKLIKAGVELAQSLKVQDGGLSSDFTKKWDSLSAAYAAGAIGLDDLLDAQRVLLAQQPAMEKQAKALEEAQKAEANATAEASKAYVTHMASLDASTAKLQEQVTARADDIARMGLSKQAIAELDAARLEEQATILDGIAIKRLDRNLDQVEYNALKEQARLKRELARLAREGASKEAAQDLEKESQKAADKAAADWARAAEKIYDSITDALMRGFENGKGYMENLRDATVNMFKTMVLRPVVEMGVRGGLSMLGLGGASGAASAADVLGGMGAAGNAASGLSMLGGLSGWLTDFGGSVTSTVNNIGRSITDLSEISGSYGSTVDSIGTSIQGSAAAVGQFATYAGYAAAAVGVFDAASKGQWGRAIGTGVGAIWGPITSAIGGAIGGWVDDAFGGGHEYTTGTGISGKFSGNNFAGRNYQDWRNDGSSGFLGIGGSGSSSGTNYSAMDTALQKSLGSAFAGIKTQTAAFALALGLSATSIQAFSKDIKLSLGSDAAANQQAIASMMQGIANDAAATVLDAQYIRQGEAAADTLARLATNLTLVNGSFDTLDKILLTTSQAGGDTASQLVDALGGLQQYQSGMAAYYQAFYSEEERQAKTREQTRKALADLGFAMPTTLQGYRDLVTAQEVSTEAGRKTFAALINLSTAFASVTTEVDGLQTAFVNTAKGIKTLVDSIASVRSGVASDRLSLGPQTVMGMDSIRAAVAAISASAPAPSTAAMDAARLAASKADTALTAAQATAEAKAAALATATTDNAALVAKVKTAASTAQNLATSYGLSINSSKATDLFANDAYSYNAAANRVNDWFNFGYRTWTDTLKTYIGGIEVGSASTTHDTSVNIKSLQNALRGNSPGYVYQSGSGTYEAGSLIDILSGANTKLAAQSKKVADAQAASIAAQTALSTATGNKATADAAATAAALAYSQAVDAWTVEASKSVPALDKLREQTLKYYESQKALAELMGTSAANLRVAVQTARTGQLDSAQSLAQQQSSFATAYSLALSTSGAVQAGYADKLTATLPELSAALMDTATSRADWAQATAKLFAQSESVAQLLEANAPVNYQADSLAMLDSIDATLAVLDDSTRSITRAIESSGGLTAAGLREVVQALGGTPGFATGGYHSGGARWVGENGPELEVTGPSHIFNMGQLRKLGNKQQGSDMDAVVAVLNALRQDNANMRAELRSIAVSNNKMAKVLERVTPDGNSVQMVVAA